ncbi:MAG TPA: zinc-ribbon domain-containing protein, partial [Polyangia bacterium]|nr:zinc-ribbon domain-containing protein [Polyangia bacterium]
MSAEVRCPHCKAELPDKASFCARCGRRVEGWSVPKDATPAMGETALPDGDEATRQMNPTPSLLRAAAISVKKGAGEPRRRSHLPLVLAMIVVAVAGGVGGFLIVRARVRRSPSIVTAPPPAPIVVTQSLARPPTAAPPQSVTPNPQLPTPNAPPKTLVRKSKTGKRAHVIASVPVPVKARASSSGGLPHKQVATDSKPLAMPTVQHETTSESPSTTAPPPSEADDKQEGEAGVDADSV